MIFVKHEESEKRREICKKCEEYDKKWDRCRQCGCFISIKTKFKSAKCPLDKWCCSVTEKHDG